MPPLSPWVNAPDEPPEPPEPPEEVPPDDPPEEDEEPTFPESSPPPSPWSKLEPELLLPHASGEAAAPSNAANKTASMYFFISLLWPARRETHACRSRSSQHRRDLTDTRVCHGAS